MMRGRLAAWVAAIGLLLASDAEARSRRSGPKAHGHDAAAHDGAALYAKYCALCHADDRSGYAADHAPSLRSPELMGNASGQFLWSAVSLEGPAHPGRIRRRAGRATVPRCPARTHGPLVEEAGGESPLEDAPVKGDLGVGAVIYGDTAHPVTVPRARAT